MDGFYSRKRNDCLFYHLKIAFTLSKLNCILLIEDNEADNFYHKIILQDMDIAHHIRIVENGQQALNYLLNEGDYRDKEQYPSPDLIFLDINMPLMNAWEFLEKYVQIPDDKKRSHTIVMVSTSSNPFDKKKAEAIREINEFTNKPLSEEIVLKIAGKYFGIQA